MGIFVTQHETKHHKSHADETDTFNAFVSTEICSKLFSNTAVHKNAVFRNGSTSPTLQTAKCSQRYHNSTDNSPAI